MLNSKYWKEEIAGMVTGVTTASAAVGVSIYEIYKKISDYFISFDSNKIISGKILENI